MDNTAALTRLKRMVAWDQNPLALTSEEVADLLKLAAVIDLYGVYPFLDDAAYDSGTYQTTWRPTWNLPRAAAEGWRLKAAAAAALVNVSDQGTSMAAGDLIDHCERMVKVYSTSRGKTLTVGRYTRPTDIVVND